MVGLTKLQAAEILGVAEDAEETEVICNCCSFDDHSVETIHKVNDSCSARVLRMSVVECHHACPVVPMSATIHGLLMNVKQTILQPLLWVR
jgi:hypothetical protein